MEKKDTQTDNGLGRYLEINHYLFEQEAPLPAAEPPVEDPLADTAAPEGEVPAEVPTEVPGEELPPAEEGGDPLEANPTAEDDTTEEVDITDLVNMIKDVKKDLDEPQQQDPGETQRMDDVFSKLGELEAKLSDMDQVIAKIDELGDQIENVTPPTPVEKLEMRSLDSGPFDKKPQEFFNEKQEEMRKSGKNEYVLTKGDVENYGKYDMMKSFNPTAQD